MCLYVEYGCKPQIAEKDIICWKLVYDLGEQKNKWQAIYRETIHQYNQILEGCKKLEIEIQDDGILIINKGFHAFIDVAAIYERKKEKPKASKVRCVIPKGAEYCYGIIDDIVSTKMIVFKTDADYKEYLRQKNDERN